ncbi:MAG: signal peptidase I [Sedimentisphaerales bacterium]|jgi:signal peptidase I|nr:signal peptidase I [Sedimentisphaerales bacterium]
MTDTTSQDKMDRPARHKDRAAEIANTFEWLITAFILAFLFRAFVMEAFRIPTGSMAETLMGAHFRLACPECGFEFNHGFVPQRYGLPEDTVPSVPVALPPVRCPSCGYVERGQPFDQASATVCNGDRILVLKCLYQFLPPKRWDVVVFKNPRNPSQNYIKRLVGLPGEKVEIFDGDLYINDHIVRKPPSIQRVLWMPVYDNDFQPVHQELAVFNLRPWQMPFDTTGTSWRVAKEQDPTSLILDGPPDQLQAVTYSSPSANDFRTVYAYNDLGLIATGSTAICNDLMVRFYVDLGDRYSQVGGAISRNGTQYQGIVHADGLMELKAVEAEQVRLLAQDQAQIRPGRPIKFQFAHVDRQLVMQVGNKRLAYPLDGSRSSASKTTAVPRLQILGSGRLTIWHIGIFRDIYYTSYNPRGPRYGPGHATEGNPFQLGQEEYFVLGDNSPNSEDARWWPAPSTASRGQAPPRAGVVPSYYMMGKAMVVYWPSGFQVPWPGPLRDFAYGPDMPGPLRILQALMRMRWIPNVGKVRFIYGGISQ